MKISMRLAKLYESNILLLMPVLDKVGDLELTYQEFLAMDREARISTYGERGRVALEHYGEIRLLLKDGRVPSDN